MSLLNQLLNIYNKITTNSDLTLETIIDLKESLTIINENSNSIQLENNDSISEKDRKIAIYRAQQLICKLEQMLEDKENQLLLEYRMKTEENYESELNKYLDNISTYNCSTIVFMFSGTTQIQKVKGNRPIRMTLELLKRNIPVIYSFWRWSIKDAFVEHWNQGLLFESPVDKTLDYFMKIITYDFLDKEKICIINFPYPNVLKYVDTLKFYGWTVIYDIRDDWEEFYYVGQAKWYKQTHELYLIERADIVTAVSKTLKDKFENLTTKNVIVVPNALDPTFLVKNNNLERTKIGYIGHLTSSWFDWDNFLKTTNMLPNYTFEIIGHSMPIPLEDLPSNVIYLGPKSFENVVEISKQWKIAVIPFKINKLCDAVDPIKVYEYLGLGLKVVSSRMPQIRDYPEVTLIESYDNFAAEIINSMNTSFNDSLVNDFLLSNMWSNRIDTILALVHNYNKFKANNKYFKSSTLIYPPPLSTNETINTKYTILFIYKYAILGGVTTQLVNRLKGLRSKCQCHFAFLFNYGGLSAFGDYPYISLIKNEIDLQKLLHTYSYDAISIIDTNEAYDWLKSIDFTGLIINEVHTTTSNIEKIEELKSDLPMNIIIVPSLYMKNLIENNYGFKDIVPVEIVPNCLDFLTFHYDTTNKSNDDNNIIVWVGKLDSHKRWEDFLDICIELEQSNNISTLQYFLVGGVTANQSIIDELIEKIYNNNLTNKFSWYSSVAYDDMIKIYSMAIDSGGVYISTTKNESFGMSVLEAMSVGLPVVIPSVGALPELLKTNELQNMSIYPPKDIKSACTLIVNQLNHYYTYSIDEFSPEETAKTYLSIIDKYINS